MDSNTWVMYEVEPSLYLAALCSKTWLPRHVSHASLRGLLLHTYNLMAVLMGGIQWTLDKARSTMSFGNVSICFHNSSKFRLHAGRKRRDNTQNDCSYTESHRERSFVDRLLALQGITQSIHGSRSSWHGCCIASNYFGGAFLCASYCCIQLCHVVVDWIKLRRVLPQYGIVEHA